MLDPGQFEKSLADITDLPYRVLSSGEFRQLDCGIISSKDMLEVTTDHLNQLGEVVVMLTLIGC